MSTRAPIGKRRHRIAFVEIETTTDDVGSVVEEECARVNRWTRVVALSGRELEDARQVNEQVTHRLTCAYTDRITTKWIALHRGKRYQLHQVIDMEHTRKELVILAEERRPTEC